MCQINAVCEASMVDYCLKYGNLKLASCGVFIWHKSLGEFKQYAIDTMYWVSWAAKRLSEYPLSKFFETPNYHEETKTSAVEPWFPFFPLLSDTLWAPFCGPHQNLWSGYRMNTHWCICLLFMWNIGHLQYLQILLQRIVLHNKIHVSCVLVCF